MVQFGIQWKFNDNLFDFRTSEEDLFKVSFSPSDSMLNFKESLFLNGEKVSAKFNGEKLFILLSGGMDSELAYRSLVESHDNVVPIIFRHKNMTNYHDIENAILFCDSKKIKYRIMDIDIESFLDNEMIIYTEKYGICYPYITVLIEMCKRAGSPIVIGGGDLRMIQINGNFFVYYREQFTKVYEYFIKNNIQGIARFFEYTPELIKSYLNDEIMMNWVTNKSKTPYLDIKKNIYMNAFPDLIDRKKFHGYELIWDRYVTKRDWLLSTAINKTIYIEYNELLDAISSKERKWFS